jgi:hypothetical protein
MGSDFSFSRALSRPRRRCRRSGHTSAAAFGDWRTDAPGVRRLITPADLPAPFATKSAASRSQRRAPGVDVQSAAGLRVDLFASGLNTPRVPHIAPNGVIFVAETGAGRVRALSARQAWRGPRKARSSPTACSACMGSPSIRQGEPALRLCRDAGLRHALSLSQRRCESLRSG